MDGLGVVAPRRFQDAIDAQVTFVRRGGPDVFGLIGYAHVERGAVGVRVDGHGANPHFPQRPDDPHGDFAAVRDEYFLNPVKTNWPQMNAGNRSCLIWVDLRSSPAIRV